MTTSIIFRWQPVMYRSATSAAMADVPGLGRLYVRRTADHARTFSGFINGKKTDELYPSLDDGKKHLEELAVFLIEHEEGKKDDSQT
jgi:hypothetical protein